MAYDSAPETHEHRQNVRHLLYRLVGELLDRSIRHDDSKLQDPEKQMFDTFTPMLRGTNYGSPEYKELLAKMGPALQHHYENNSHHPEHFPNGINGMNLLDVLEMLADWKAAGMRHNDGDLQQSLEINKTRFQISDQLAEILANTVRDLGW